MVLVLMNEIGLVLMRVFEIQGNGTCFILIAQIVKDVASISYQCQADLWALVAV